ncbi:MAG: DUF1080 domain-containing protein, partial [Actinomycetota bacterium]|nr:DUF1080 domain-containing protein [Actinomycetota bacterium]
LTGNRGELNKEDHLEAPLAVASASPRAGAFAVNKFSSVQLLFRAQRIAQAEAQAAARPGTPEVQNSKKRLMVVANCYVTRLERSGSRITRIHVKYQGADSQVDVPATGSVFLALGTIENTRQALLAVPEKPEIGHNLMAHLRSNLTFRVPRDSFNGLPPELQVSALFVKGIHTHPGDNSTGHYHIQITASGVGELGMNSEAELFKKIPNIEELDQFRDLTDKWVVITLRGIGEMVGVKSGNPINRIRRGDADGNGVPRAEVRLETNWEDPADPRITDLAKKERTKDNDLWDAMDAACDELAQIFANGGTIEYLSRPNEAGIAHWQAGPPANPLRRDKLSSTHHEAGPLWMGDDPNTSVTDPNGRIWETDNLYVVGPALLPTIGSPNPMLSGVALSRRTADKIGPKPLILPAEANFTALFDGTERTFQRWRSAGPGAFALQDGLLVAQPAGDQAVLFYAAETFTDYVLRLQFRVPGPVDSSGKAIGNSGVFLRFRYPDPTWDFVNQVQPLAQKNPAWVATVTGFEVQIDEQGIPDFGAKHRTGALYGIPAGEGGEQQEQTYRPGPVLQPGTWYEFEITVAGDHYVVQLGQVQDGQPTAFNQVADFTRPQGKYQNRGLAPAADPASGYIGLQAHTGKIAFRRIRIQEQ